MNDKTRIERSSTNTTWLQLQEVFNKFEGLALIKHEKGVLISLKLFMNYIWMVKHILKEENILHMRMKLIENQQ